MSEQSIWFDKMVGFAKDLGWNIVYVHLEDDGDSVDGVLFTSNEELADKLSKLSEDGNFRPRQVGIID